MPVIQVELGSLLLAALALGGAIVAGVKVIVWLELAKLDKRYYTRELANARFALKRSDHA